MMNTKHYIGRSHALGARQTRKLVDGFDSQALVVFFLVKKIGS